MTQGRAPSSRRSACLVAAVVGLAALPSGCQLTTDPFRDAYVVHPVTTTTASADGARAAQTTPAVRQRDYVPIVRHSECGIVTHGPLYFEDPFEDKGSEDGQFAWTGEDYLQLVYWRARFLLNGLALPVSAVVTPPWTVMVSDGHLSRQALGYDHDAERYRPPPPGEATPCHQDSSSAGG